MIQRTILLVVLAVGIALGQFGIKVDINNGYWFGYNRVYGEIWKYYYSEQEPATVYYGFSHVGDLKFPVYHPEFTSFMVGLHGKDWEVWAGWFAANVYSLQSVTLNSVQENVWYYVRLWNSILFPVIDTYNKPSFGAPQTVSGYQELDYSFYTIEAKYKKLFASFVLSAGKEQEIVKIEQYARYWTMFYNHITITDRWEGRRQTFGLKLGYSDVFKVVNGVYFDYRFGGGLAFEKFKFINSWSDIDSGYYDFKISYTPFYFDGLVAQRGHLTNLYPFVWAGLYLNFKYDQVKFYSGVSLDYVPSYYVRYDLDFPWGVGLETNAQTGMRFLWVKSQYVFARITLFGVEVRI